LPPPFYHVDHTPPDRKRYNRQQRVQLGSECLELPHGPNPCRLARGSCPSGHGPDARCAHCPCACGWEVPRSNSSSGRGSGEHDPDDPSDQDPSRFWPSSASDGYSSAGTDPRLHNNRHAPGAQITSPRREPPARRAPTRAQQHPPSCVGGDGQELHSAFHIELDARVHTLWKLPPLQITMFPGVSRRSFENLTSSLTKGGGRAIAGAVAKIDTEQMTYFQTLTAKEYISEKKDARTIDKVALQIISTRKRQRDSSTAAAQDRAPALPLSMNATKRAEHVTDLLSLVETRFQINFHRMDLLFELLSQDVKQAVINWGAAQGPGTECYDTTLKKKPLYPHWAHAVSLLHDTVEVEQDRVDDVIEKLERLLKPHKAHEFSDIERYLDLTLAAYTLANTEPALRLRMKESSWTRTRAFVEQALLPKHPATTLWHAHVYHTLKLAYTKLLNEDARRRGAACDDAAMFTQATCASPPKGYPDLTQMIALCKTKLTSTAKEAHRNHLASLGISTSEDKGPRENSGGPRHKRGRSTSPGAGTAGQRPRSRSRDRNFREKVRAAATRLDISEDRAEACFRDVNIAGALAETSPGPSCYACGSSDHLIRDCPNKVDGVRVGRIVKCFRCQHPQYKVPEADQEHPFHKCPHRPPTKTTADARKVWCFQCSGEHTLRDCPKLTPAQLEVWLKIMRPKRDGQNSRAGWHTVAAFQAKIGAVALACVNKKKPRVASSRTLKRLVNKFDPGALPKSTASSVTTAAATCEDGLNRIAEVTTDSEESSSE